MNEMIVCNHCNGLGKITWLENIFGKKEEVSDEDHVQRMKLAEETLKNRRRKKGGMNKT